MGKRIKYFHKFDIMRAPKPQETTRNVAGSRDDDGMHVSMETLQRG